MSTWTEQLEKIEQLREARRLSDANSYASAIQLNKAIKKLDKINNQETVLPSGGNDINIIKKKIAGLEARIRDLNDQLSERRKVLIQLEDKNDLIGFLQKKIKVTRSSIQEIAANIQEEKNKQKPDRAKIDEWTQLLKQLQSLLAQLEEDLAKAEQEKNQLSQEAGAERERRREIEAGRGRLLEEKKNEEEKLATMLETEQPDKQEWEEKKRKQRNEYKSGRDKLDEVRGQLHTAIGSIYVDPHPKTAIKNLDDKIPFLLLPVRIETRFVNQGRQPELLLRIYPDDIAVHTHEGILTDKEITEGEKYWKVIFNAEKGAATGKEDRKRSAWSYLATLFGSQRSAWVARETQPTNWTGLDDLEQEDELVFPVHDLTKTSDWSRAPRTEILPDKFVAIFYEGDTIVRQETGNIIPDELFLGPDPMDAEAAFVMKDNKLVFGTGYDWMSDFDKAVEFGMGFRIPLSQAQAVNGFSKILVLGVSLSSNETTSGSAIESLINNHHYSPKGFSLVRQGAPTNNTDLEESGYTKNDSFNEISYYTETGKPKFSFPDECDGRNLADALGIEYGPLQYVLNSDAQDHQEAVAMNTALYASTLGYYFGSMMQPVVGESFQSMLRDFSVNHVTGRGWLPAIRVGNQPYGVLLTSDTSKWEWPEHRRLLVGDSFYKTIWKILEDYHTIWKSLLNELVHVGKPGMEPSEVLMNIL
ncbi:MAG TPA: hypothetical protein VK589_26785, partial [Chryseolinea sp.]|nr:hypothetical protein [Chryseolinea sp.]